jgi:hypothetical protein
VGKQSSDGDSKEVELQEEEDEQVVAVRSRKGLTGSQNTGKRKKVDVGKIACIKKFKFEGDVEKGTPKSKKGLVQIKAVPEIRPTNNQNEVLSPVLCKGESSVLC